MVKKTILDHVEAVVSKSVEEKNQYNIRLEKRYLDFLKSVGKGKVSRGLKAIIEYSYREYEEMKGKVS